MASEIADLFITLRTVSDPLTKGFNDASKTGESFISKMGGVSGALSKLGGATVAAAAGVAVVSVKMAGDFQANMTRLVTSAGESTKALAQVSKGVLDIAVATGTSTKQLAQGLYTIESAGFHGAQGLTVLTAAAKGAKSENADLSVVADAVTTALRDYNLKASDSTRVVNTYIAAVSEGKTTFQDFASSLSTVQALAASAGIKLGDMTGVLATLTDHGVSAQEATQQMAFTIRSLEAPSNVAVNTMAQLGISATDVSQQLGQKGLSGTVLDLSRAVLQHMGPSGLVLLNAFNQSAAAAQDAQVALSKLPNAAKQVAQSYADGKITLADYRLELKGLPADQAALVQQFVAMNNKAKGFSQELKNGTPQAKTYQQELKNMLGGANGLQLALQLGSDGFVGMEHNVNNTINAYNKGNKSVSGFAEVQKTFNFQLAQLREVAEKAGIQLGTKLIPPLIDAMKWAEKNTGTLKVLAGVIAGVLSIAVVTWAGKTTMSFVKGMVDIGKSAVSTTSSLIKGFKGVSDAVVENEKVVKEATVANKLGSLFSTIASGAKQAAMAIGSVTKSLVLQAAQAVKTAAAWVAEKVAVVASAIAEKAAAVAQWILNIAMDANPVGLIILAIAALIAIVILLVTHWKQVSKFFSALWKDIKAIFWDAVHAIGGAISAAIKWVEGLPKKAGAAFDKFIGFVKALPGNVLKGIEQLPKIFDAGLKKLGFAIGYALGWIVKQFIEMPVKIWNAITHLWDEGYRIWVQGATKVVNFVKSLPARIEKFFVDNWHEVVRLVKQTWSDVYNFFVQGGTKVINWVTSLPGKIEKFAVDTYNGVTSWVSKTWDDLYSTFVAGLNKAITWVSSMPGKIAKFFTDLYNGAIAEVKKLWNDVVSFFTSLPGKVVSVVSGLPGQISKLWNQLVSDAVNFGKNIITGLLNGLKAMADTVVKWVKDFAGSIGSGFMKALGISSPSKVFHSFGQNIAQGLVNGLKSMSGTVSDQAKALANTAMAGFGSPTLQVAAAGAAGPVGIGTQTGTLAVNTASLAVGANSAATSGANSGPVTLYFDLDGKTFAKAVYPNLAALVQQHKRRNSAKSGTMLS